LGMGFSGLGWPVRPTDERIFLFLFFFVSFFFTFWGLLGFYQHDWRSLWRFLYV
jgi:hypothetical protein